MLRCCGAQSLLVAGLAVYWLAVVACVHRDTPVSSDDHRAGATTTGEGLRGRVLSTAGTPIGGALVLPRSLDGAAVPEMAVETDDTGSYEWSLTPGRYDVTVSAEGFTAATRRATVARGQQATLDFTLQPAAR